MLSHGHCHTTQRNKQERCSFPCTPLTFLCKTLAVTASATARERARAELTFEIKEAARRQLAGSGAAELSVRAVARELGMVSSAVYRYFPSRDDLLTALIVDAYEALARALATADSRVTRSQYRRRWIGACKAMRRWARDNPHEYSLIYGSPVPGYQAPRDTVEPAGRVFVGFLGIIGDAVAAGALSAPGRRGPPSARLEAQLAAVARQFGADIPTPVLAATFLAIGQLSGLISLELYGHFVGTLDPTEPFFDYAVQGLADLVGMPER